MGQSCSCVDCCFGLRKYNQCCFPCITSCGYPTKKIFYNYDGTEIVQPVVDIFTPSKKKLRGNLITGMELSGEELRIARGPEDQLALVVRYASENSIRCRAVGTGSSWTKLTHTRDLLIDMSELDEILSPTSPNEEAGATSIQITVQGGKKVTDFVKEIYDKFGMGFPAMGNYAGQTVAGICSTSTHGSAYNVKTMSNFAVAFHLIIAGGVSVKVRRPRNDEEHDETFVEVRERVKSAVFGDPPLEIVSNDIFRAVAVSLGSMGVIYSVTFECVRSYDITEVKLPEEIPWPADPQDFRLPDSFEEMYKQEGSYFSFFVNPYQRQRSGGEIVKGVSLRGEKTDHTRDHKHCDYCIDLQCCCGVYCRGKTACQVLQTDCSATLLQWCAMRCPICVPCITDCGLSNFTRERPYIQKWFNVLTFTNGNIHIKTAEYCLPLSDLNRALAEVIKLSQEYAEKYDMYSLLPIYCRLAESDDLYLSPANQHRRNTEGQVENTEKNCYIEVPFLPGSFGIDEYHRILEDHLFRNYRARPHWGKNSFLNNHRIRHLYPDFIEWRKVFLLFNHDRTFDNDFTDKCGFGVVDGADHRDFTTEEAVTVVVEQPSTTATSSDL